MLSKKHRVDRKGINILFMEGRSITSLSLSFRFIVNSNPNHPRISFTAPKSVARLGVMRNKLRRLGYKALGKYISEFPRGTLGVFIFRAYEDDISKIEQAIAEILARIR